MTPATATTTPRLRKGRPYAEGPLSAAQQALAAQWYPYALGWAKRRARALGGDPADSYSAAGEAVCRAARNYDPSINESFTTYLDWHLRDAHKCLSMARIPTGYRLTGCLRRNPEAIARRVPEIIPTVEGLDRPGHDPAPERVDGGDLLAAVMARLTPMERAIVGENLTLDQIIERYTITRKYATRKKARAWARARELAAELSGETTGSIKE